MDKNKCGCCERDLDGVSFIGMKNDKVCVCCKWYSAYHDILFKIPITPELIDTIKKYIKSYQ